MGKCCEGFDDAEMISTDEHFKISTGLCERLSPECDEDEDHSHLILVSTGALIS